MATITASNSSTSQTWSTDGNADNVEINAALAWAHSNGTATNKVTVSLPAGTYDIQAQMLLGSNTILKGAGIGKTILKLNDNAEWPDNDQNGAIFSKRAAGIKNIEVYGLEFNGNDQKVTKPTKGSVCGEYHVGGNGYYNFIELYGSSSAHITDLSFHDMKLYDSLGDGIRLCWVDHVQIYNCEMNNLQHSSIMIDDGDDVDIHHNVLRHIANAAIRPCSCINMKIHHNTLTVWRGPTTCGKYNKDTGAYIGATWWGGDNCIQVDNKSTSGHRNYTNNIEIYNNNIFGAAHGGICLWDINYSANGNKTQKVHIFNNVISKDAYSVNGNGYSSSTIRNGGIVFNYWSNGVVIENNDIDYNLYGGITVIAANTSGITATVRNNNIRGTTKVGSTGYGIINKVSSKLTINGTNNYMSGNASGNFSGATSTLASSPITARLPISDTTTPDTGGDTGTGSTGGTGGSDGNPYIPPIFRLISDEEDLEYYTEGQSGYVNRVPFGWQRMHKDVAKTIVKDKTPSFDGEVLSDMGWQGGDVTLDCWAFSVEERDRCLAAFFRKGRSTIELGGDYQGWQIRGMAVNYSDDCDLSEDVPAEAIPYSVLVNTDTPFKESTLKRVRSRYIYQNQSWNSDDAYKGNIVRNPGFENAQYSNTMSWTARTSPTPDINFEAFCAAEDLLKMVAIGTITTGGSNPCAVTTNGTTWTQPSTAPVLPSQAWRGICRSPELGYFFAVSSDGTYRAAKSNSGDDGWTLLTGMTEVSNWYDCCWSPEKGIFLAVATSGTNRICTYNGTQFSFKTGPSPAHTWNCCCWAPDIVDGGLFVIGSADGYIAYSADADNWTVVQAPSPVIALSGICYSKPLKLLAASSSTTGISSNVIVSTNASAWFAKTTPDASLKNIIWSNGLAQFIAIGSSGICIASQDADSWNTITTPNTNGYFAIGECNSLNIVAAAAQSGTANRIMTCNNELNVAGIDNWTSSAPGGSIETEDYFEGSRCLKLTGTGTDIELGNYTQEISVEPGFRYVLAAYGKVTGLTQGSLRVDVTDGSNTVKELIWDADTEQWTNKNIVFRFEVLPAHVYIRVRGTGTPNSGAVLLCDKLLIEKKSDFEVSETGQSITTYGNVDVVPSVSVKGILPNAITPTAGTQQIVNSGTDTIYSTTSTSFNPTYPGGPTFNLAAKAGTKYRIDEISCKLKSADASATASLRFMCNMPVRGTADFHIGQWSTASTGYVSNVQAKTGLISGAGEAVTLKSQMMTSNATHKAYATEVGFKYTEIIDGGTGSGAIVNNSIYFYNNNDISTVMRCATSLYPGWQIDINNDNTGAFQYSEDFSTNAYATIAAAIVGTVTWNKDSRTITVGQNSSIDFFIDCSYSIVGIPFMTCHVKTRNATGSDFP